MFEFINPLNNSKQICSNVKNNNINNKINKDNLNKLILYLYNNNNLQYNKPLSLRILRKISYEDCCNLLYQSNLKINDIVETINYNNINCLNLTYRDLYNLIKKTNLSISKYKINMCSDLIKNGYVFKDTKLILNKQEINNTNNNNILIDENIDMPINILILKYGIKIKSLENTYIYIIPDKLSNIIINNIKKIITIGFINRTIKNITLKYINLDYTNYTSGILVEPKYNEQIPDIEYIINQHHNLPTLSKKKIVYANNYYDKFTPNVWAKKYCSNYNELDKNNKQICNDSIALKNNVVCVQDINGKNIQSNILIKLLNNMCISKNEYKIAQNINKETITPIKFYGKIKLKTLEEVNEWSKNNCVNYDTDCNLETIRKYNKVCVKNNYTNQYILKNNIIKTQNSDECYDINDLHNLTKFDKVKLTNNETIFLNKIK